MNVTGKKIAGIATMVAILSVVFGAIFGASMKETVILTALMTGATIYLLLSLHQAPSSPSE